ncbi:MAG: response regulator transcription factor [Eubacterium sp.]|nr:response regulator transcription factor [Eubacterium sp.]
MNNILIVEDEKSISGLIRLGLSKAGYKCTCAFDGVSAADLLESNRYDLVLLDIMLPGFDGFTLMDYIRPMEIPVIFITAKGSVEDRVKGLRAGAEDYIVKPFDIVELLARIEVVLRRYNKLASVMNIGSVTIDTYSRLVKKNDEEIHLTPKEYDLLLLFVQNPNRAMYRETIYERVWGEEFLYGSKTVDLHIQRLRKKLGWEQHIQAVNKIGYRFEV